MPLKKVDNRIRTVIENSVISRHRCFFVIVGDHGRDQVVILHHMLSKAVVKARPSVLWCYKKELGFSSHRKKRMKQLQKKIKSGTLDVKEDDPFELFIAATDIRYCYYADTHKILGNTYGMCVLQDFEALTPNLLARTVETVEGGGMVILLLRTMTSLRQLCTMSMDVHARYRTEVHQHVKARFNERFLLSLADCSTCVVMDDQLHVLPLSSHTLSLTPLPPNVDDENTELASLKLSLADTQPVGKLVACCITLDQAKALLKFVEAISEQTLRSTVALTASRGRGKSAALGLAIAAAVAFGYSNIFVTSPSPENLRTLFEFLLRGFDSISFVEHEHYEVVQSTHPDFNKAVVRVNIFQQHRQTVQYLQPSDAHKLEQAELLCIDEAAAIPLPLVKKMLGPYLVFMASTINGYEGTGRSLSLKLIDGLRRQTSVGVAGGRVLREVKLEEPIRYHFGDPVEAWLHQLLCLDANSVARATIGRCPDPQQCNLYYVNRDTLFCYHKASELFLHRLMSLYVSSHYKNSPNDLQLLSDAPAHHIFVLLGPISPDTAAIPDVLCVLQVCLEGAISSSSVLSSLSQGRRASGDLIPWTLAQQFADHGFASLSGARVVRIATHPDYQRMGYGTRALQLLLDYYQGKMTGLLEQDTTTDKEGETINCCDGNEGLLKEVITPQHSLPPLLTQLHERKPDQLQYVGVSFGLTSDLLRFWSRNKFQPVYIRQTPNDLTGEHSCIMLRQLEGTQQDWLHLYNQDFKKRFLSLLGYQFRSFTPSLSLGVLSLATEHKDKSDVDHVILFSLLSKFDIKRLELYTRNMADYHLIVDLLPAIARLYFTHKVKFKLTVVQAALLLGLGLQHKTVDMLEEELDLPASQLLGLFNRMMHKFYKLFQSVEEAAEGAVLPTCTAAMNLQPISESISQELSAEAKKYETKQKKEREELLSDHTLQQYVVSETQESWADVLDGSSCSGPPSSIVSVKGNKKSLKRKEIEPIRPVKKKIKKK